MASCHTHAATKLSSHRIHGTHRNDWRRRKICVHLCASVGGSSTPEASVYSVNSVGGLAQTNLEWVLWEEFGGRRGYGRDAIPSYICGHPCNPWEDCDVGAAETAAPPKGCHATTTRLPRHNNNIATLQQQYCHATTTRLPRYGNKVATLRQNVERRM